MLHRCFCYNGERSFKVKSKLKMEKFEITKEQILEFVEWGNSKDQEKVKQWFPKAFESKFKIGQWYKHPRSSMFCLTEINPNGVMCGYGFFNGKWDEYNINYSGDGCACNEVAAKELKLATDQEVEAALINEAKKRGFKEGVYCKSFEFNENEIIHNGNYAFDENQEYCYYGGVKIYKNGKWAEIITTITKREAEEKLGIKII